MGRGKLLSWFFIVIVVYLKPHSHAGELRRAANDLRSQSVVNPLDISGRLNKPIFSWVVVSDGVFFCNHQTHWLQGLCFVQSAKLRDTVFGERKAAYSEPGDFGFSARVKLRVVVSLELPPIFKFMNLHPLEPLLYHLPTLSFHFPSPHHSLATSSPLTSH